MVVLGAAGARACERLWLPAGWTPCLRLLEAVGLARGDERLRPHAQDIRTGSVADPG